MDRHIFFRVLWGVCVAADVLHAAPSGINLMQEAYTVWGDAGYPYPGSTYSATGAGTVTGSASGTGIDGFWGTATSTAGPDGLSAYRLADAWSANAYAQCRYLFTPDWPDLVLDVSGVIGEWAFENVARVSLADSTTATLVDSYVSPHTWDTLDPTTVGGFTFAFQRDLLVDPTHVYELVGFVEAHRGEGGTGAAEMTLAFHTVPAPSALVLCGLGVALGAWLRRRRTR